MSSRSALRSIALNMLDSAHRERNEAEHRLWQARDDAVKARLLHLDAQQREALAQRDFDRSQEFLTMMWSDIKPLVGDYDATNEPDRNRARAALGDRP